MWLDLIQWPAMAVTIVASGLITSTEKRRKNWGFWLFLASNVLWVAWGWSSHAYALIAMQFCLATMNIRGAVKTEPSTGSSGTSTHTAKVDSPPRPTAAQHDRPATHNESVAGEEDPGAAIDVMT